MESRDPEERHIELAKKWLDGTITPVEEKEFAEWYNQAQDEVVLPQSFASGSEELKQRIFQKINQGRLEKSGKVVRMGKRARWIAAAAIIILIGGAAWFITQYRSQNDLPTQTAINIQHTGTDALPGHQGAVLTLADGTVVTLDSAVNGVITKQGATNIVKENGTISYSDQPSSASNEVVYNTLTTPKGRTYSLELNDGTKVWLDAGSSIRYPVTFTGNERKVEVTGQAWFDVVHNAKMPFKVMARGVEINDLGTEFNVNGYNDEAEVKVTLLKGAVKIKDVTLKPGQQASVSNPVNPSVRDIRFQNNVDVDQVLAWKNGRFQFQEADIQTVMKQIGRWYDMEIVYEGAIPGDRFAGMISRYTNLSNVLKILSLSGVQYKIEGNKLTVINK